MTAALDTNDEVPPYGPKMLALLAKRRAFVTALYDEDAPAKGDGLLIYAARTAGYGNSEGTSSNKSLSVIANRIVQDPGVKEAIAEYSRGIVRAIAPEAVRAVRNLVRDKGHKDHARAALAVMDRIDPLETTHNIRVEDVRLPPIEMTEKVLVRIEELARRAGVALPAPVIVDADFKVVGDGAAA